MDLSKLSDKDLEALASGNMAAMSDAALQALSGAPIAPPRQANQPRSEEHTSELQSR